MSSRSPRVDGIRRRDHRSCPSGLSAAIPLKQLTHEKGVEFCVCVLDRGSEVGAHILSGAVMDPRALNELLPDCKQNGASLDVEVTEDRFPLFDAGHRETGPQLAFARQLQKSRHYVVSLANVTRWIWTTAETLGVENFSGFPAAEPLYNDDGSVRGVVTGNMGVGRDGQPQSRNRRKRCIPQLSDSTR